MSWLLFLDESGHDHRTTPYEVRGGVALHASELWPFVQDMQRLELAAFGTELNQFRTELKGSTLLDKDRFKWAAQGQRMSDEERRKHCRGFLTKGLEKMPPSRTEFTAYGQACRLPTRGMNAMVRREIADDFGRWLAQLQFQGQGYRDGSVYELYGIVFVPDPYTARRGEE